MSKTKTVVHSVSGGTIALIFVALKIFEVINWSWWWVLCPLWLGFAVAAGLFVFYIIFTILIMIFK